MMKILGKAFDKFDGLIILAAIFLFTNFDYDNLSTFNKVYMASFGFWAVTKLIQLYIVYRNKKG